MIIAKTPFRISFVGGSTDYPDFFKEHGGAILGTSIDKYCYIMVRKLPPNFQNKYRLVYKNEEFVDVIDEIHHPAIRECLRYMKITDGMEIVHWADMPARKGMGSSSAFTVGLLNALHCYKHKICSNLALAKLAIEIEQEWIKENVGCQDQYLTSLGGMNFITFGKSTSIQRVNPRNLEKYLLLFDTGHQHIASEVAGKIIKNIPNKLDVLSWMRDLTFVAKKALNDDILEFGRLLDRTWALKKLTSDSITNPLIDGIYKRGMSAGALGGKLLGAGEAGYFLFFVEPSKQEDVRKSVNLKEIKFQFENRGSEIIHASD